MTPIVCVGETLEEREADGTESKVTQQVAARVRRGRCRAGGAGGRRVRADLGDRHRPDAEPGDAGRVVEVIRTRSPIGSTTASRGLRVQYGGSVKPGNIREFMAHPEIDGALVGGASLDPEEFALIVKYR